MIVYHIRDITAVKYIRHFHIKKNVVNLFV